ncbi:Gfo/Idh/MocA family protein [Fodinibius sediminis]|uniref:Predicted dehydrogenase n=1 Tax=Fodinibius sediminis TaxID=1214077 RepID=A0A521CVF6_9BACT|nr:Gfo/Idh/MocA family oxidoreductase [Fodinibius sediminis]SMO62711.1 Predicted dehydrogenase [Fodinibius sediminis]
MDTSVNRRNFIKLAATAGLGMSLQGPATLWGKTPSTEDTKVGIIGLDTSHSIAFAKALNDPDVAPDLAGFPVVAAYPKGSLAIESSYSRIPKYTEQVKEMGVEIVDSIDELLDKVDVVLLETNDGNRHLEQVLPVFKAGKPVFIDKPIAGSLSDTIAIFEASEKYGIPTFCSSSLRYMENAQAIRNGEAIGQVTGADTYSPASLEESHPDLYWYGVHGVETLFTVMGTGCESVVRVHTDGTDIVVGTWEDGRVGTFRGRRTGKHSYGGIAFGEEGETKIGPYNGYRPLLVKVIEFFKTGKPPVSKEEILEIYAFMEAADESKRRGGESVTLDEVIAEAR